VPTRSKSRGKASADGEAGEGEGEDDVEGEGEDEDQSEDPVGSAMIKAKTTGSKCREGRWCALAHSHACFRAFCREGRRQEERKRRGHKEERKCKGQGKGFMMAFVWISALAHLCLSRESTNPFLHIPHMQMIAYSLQPSLLVRGEIDPLHHPVNVCLHLHLVDGRVGSSVDHPARSGTVLSLTCS
jgi:hypothetical protein